LELEQTLAGLGRNAPSGRDANRDHPQSKQSNAHTENSLTAGLFLLKEAAPDGKKPKHHKRLAEI
jgi:hypothetical protein